MTAVSQIETTFREEHGRVLAAYREHAAGPVQQRARRRHLGLDVHARVVVDERLDDGQVELAGVGRREAGVAVGRPLHRGADRVTVAQPDVVAHADLVAVVHVRRPGQ